MFKLAYLSIILFSVLLGAKKYDAIISDQVPDFGVLLYQEDDTTVKIVKLGEFSESNGLKKNDVIISIDGKKIIKRSDIFPILKWNSGLPNTVPKINSTECSKFAVAPSYFSLT